MFEGGVGELLLVDGIGFDFLCFIQAVYLMNACLQVFVGQWIVVDEGIIRAGTAHKANSCGTIRDYFPRPSPRLGVDGLK